MKKLGLLWVMASALMLCLTYTSCDELDDLLEDSETSEGQAFFPSDFASKTVAAWYAYTDKDKDKTKTEAVFLFTDQTFVVTKNKVYSKEDGRSPERGVEAIGTYQLTEGDFDNGKASVIISDGETMTVEIKDGKMTTQMGDEVYIRQDNSKLPKASQPSQGGSDDGNALEPFFPKAYANKNINAWYKYSGTMSVEAGYEMKYTAAIYFFKDNTYVATTNALMTTPEGQQIPQRVISRLGQYEIIQGDWTNGKIRITIDEKNSITIELKNGQLSIADLESGGQEVLIYKKQDNTKVPEASEPTENGNQGGGDQSQQGPAYFPNTYDINKVVAWYSYTESEPAETRVEAVFLLNDGTVLVTEHKIFEQSLQIPDNRNIFLIGSYTLSGNYDNGTADVIISEGYFEVGSKKNITITNGNLVVEYNNNMVYTRRELKDLPEPLEPEQGGNGQSEAKLVAWYTHSVVEGGREYTIAIILLDNGTVAFTSTPAPDGSGAMAMTTILGVGTYKIIEGDLTSGTIEIVMFDEPKQFTASNGVVVAIEDGSPVTYFQQDNSKYNGSTNFGNGDDQGGDDNPGGDDVTGNSIYGTWVDDLAYPYGALTLNSNGMGIMYEEDFEFTYKDGILVYDQESNYMVTIDGDVMTWSYIDEEYGLMDPQVWYRSNASFDKKVSDGRWNGFVGEDGDDHGMVYIFNGNDIDIYIIAWGEHLKGSFTHEGGVMSVNLSKGYNARIGDEESWSWEAGNLDPETLELTPGYSWWQMDEEVLRERQQEVAKFTFALVSDVKAYGNLYRCNVIKKAK